MSKIGKEPVTIPEKVEVEIKRNLVTVKGPQGELNLKLPHFIEVEKKDNQLKVIRKRDDDRAMAMHGTIRAHLANMVKGVVEPWTKELEVKGTGFKVSPSADGVVFELGFSHPVEVECPEGIDFQVDGNKLTISGPDIVQVGNLAAKIRKIRPPDAYQGKGIRYVGEQVKLKPGKMAKVGGAGGAGA
jgi:large subunit ribosomal protein L6